MATLNDMLLAELIKIGDTIEFTFKGNTFRAKILRGGLIGKCQQQSIHDKEPVSVLETTVGFSSLTAWTESCLQDLLEEYYTRYSSWKRVYHRESKRSMSDLRDQCKLKSTKRKHEDVAELYKEIFRLQTTIDEMNDHIAKVHKGEKIPFRRWSYLHIEPQPREPVVKKFKRFYDPFVSSTAEDAICNDSSPLNSIVKEIILKRRSSTKVSSSITPTIWVLIIGGTIYQGCLAPITTHITKYRHRDTNFVFS